MALLTNRNVEAVDDAIEVAQLYFGRWAAEEQFRLMKTGFGLENLRALKWRGVRRTVLLVHLAAVFLAWLAHTVRDLEKFLCGAAAFGPVPRFVAYRVRRVVGDVLQA